MHKNYFKPLIVAILLSMIGIFSYITFFSPHSSFLSPNNPETVVNVQIESEKPHIVEEREGELVAGFPNIPSYKNAKLLKSSKQVLGDRVYYHSQYSLALNDTRVLKWYKDQLKKDGWMETESSQADEDDASLKVYKSYYVAEFVSDEKISGDNSMQLLSITISYDQD